jgi:cellobiose phosphorylase
MTVTASRHWTTPQHDVPGLRRIENSLGLAASILPNGSLFAIDHKAIIIGQVLASSIEGGLGLVLLRIGHPAPSIIELVGPRAVLSVGVGDSSLIWAGETAAIQHRVTLRLAADALAWVWSIELTNNSDTEIAVDTILVQDLGLGSRGFLMNNEAYASQYIDHAVASHPTYGPVVLSRQNLAQDGAHPWIAQGCVDGTAAFATDAFQLYGPAYRETGQIDLPFGTDLPSQILQHEVACIALQSPAATLAPGETIVRQFFGVYQPDHPAASGAADLSLLDPIAELASAPQGKIALVPPRRTLLQDAPSRPGIDLDQATLDRLYPARLQAEWKDGTLLSFFVQDGSLNRHIVLRAKESLVKRRHGTLLRTGAALLPDATTGCMTCWMHGVFGAQLTIGNTSFHKLLSVSRDPYNIMRSSGLRILVEIVDEWQLLTVPSAFDIGLGDCRWIYRLTDRTIIIHAAASGEDSALQWQVTIEGAPCRLLLLGHLVLGEREFDHLSRIEIDAGRQIASFRPDPTWLWGQRYPNAVYHLVSAKPEAIEALGGDELLYRDNEPGDGAYIVLRTQPVTSFRFAVVGSMTDADLAAMLAQKYAGAISQASLVDSSTAFWRSVTRDLRITGSAPVAGALDLFVPWLAHNAMIHLTVPHGLEQYTGAAWGTRDVCQGPVEFLLALEHDAPVKEILRMIFAQQYDRRGDWPQWFMLEPYSIIQDRTSHGDVIVWPLKALNDYLEATDDLGFLNEPIAWRDLETLGRTSHQDPVSAHIDRLIATVEAQFIPGTSLIRYGHGDWNDSLQPADPRLADWMVSSWTVALLFHQVTRYAAVLRRVGNPTRAAELADLAERMRQDFRTHLMRDGTVAGYAIFDPASDGPPELLLHPSDTRTGLHYSLLPMKRGILSGLFTPEQARHHLALVAEHLWFPDGARLMDQPVRYQGGPESIFRRAESASYFGREIGLMYVHAHLRYGEALASQGKGTAVLDVLSLANPVAITERLSNAARRQSNHYFSSSDAAFANRYEASADWDRVKAGQIQAEGGWRVYSSGPGLFTNLLIRHALGRRRLWGERHETPLLDEAVLGMRWR